MKIVDTTLRDGQQSLIATRMSFDEMLPVIEKMDSVGFYAMEMWGGATFDCCLRFLNEDPWDRLRKIRKLVKKTKLQMLLRGQNLLGYRIFPDDVVEYCVQKCVANGIDIIRAFDALNDVRNLEVVARVAKKEGAHLQLAISYTLSKVHTLKSFIELSKKFVDLGADSICIKDMAGLLLPMEASRLVSELKKNIKVPINLHSHYTSGLASMTYLKAAESGVDILDTAMSPFALGTSQPATEVMDAVFKGSAYDTGINSDLLCEITSHFKTLRNLASKKGMIDDKLLIADIDALNYQIPGGMLSNLVSQLKMQKAEDKFEQVLSEVPLVRADLGFPPLVTPTSQIIGTQAVLNVISGERYKVVSKETKNLVRGMYGKTPAPISAEIQSKIIGKDKPISKRPASLLEPALKGAESEINIYKEQDEDVLTYLMFPNIAEDFFKLRQGKKLGVDPTLADTKNKIYPV